MVILDLGTRWREIAPTARRNTFESVKALQRFAGPNAEIKSFYSDSGKELIAAADHLNWCHTTSTPYIHHQNGVVEREIRRVEEGIRAFLERVGFDHRWWPLASQCFCMNLNCTPPADGAATPWEDRHGTAFPGKVLPFGCAIHFKPNESMAAKLPKFGPNGLPGVFLGYYIQPGGRWNGEYLVAWIEHFKLAADPSIKKGRKIPFFRVREIVVDESRPPFFPLSDDYQSLKWKVPKTIPSNQPHDQPVPQDIPSAVIPDAPADGDPPPLPEEDGAPPRDRFPELDHPFVKHAGIWFKGPYEIQNTIDGDVWIRRPYGRGPGRLPGIPVKDWPRVGHHEALWENYIKNYGPPPLVPDPKASRGDPEAKAKTKAKAKGRPRSPASSSPPATPGRSSRRRLVEFCCGEDSRLGNPKFAQGCETVRLTKFDDLRERNGVQKAFKAVTDVNVPVMMWVAIPCTGGSSRLHMSPYRH